MTEADLRSELRLDPAKIGYAPFLPDINGQVERLINAPVFAAVQPRFVTALTVLSEVTGGAAILDKLEAVAASNAAVRYALTFLRQVRGIDIGSPVTSAMIDQLAAANVITAADATSLKNMAVAPCSRAGQLKWGYISHAQICGALLFDNGTAK